ncbi:MAG: hypothetical protein HIU81_07260, partial [Acidobacteria bacterium]|nr:hypothetical protein [Acidobacteriota bacterium]
MTQENQEKENTTDTTPATEPAPKSRNQIPGDKDTVVLDTAVVPDAGRSAVGESGAGDESAVPTTAVVPSATLVPAIPSASEAAGAQLDDPAALPALAGSTWVPSGSTEKANRQESASRQAESDAQVVSESDGDAPAYAEVAGSSAEVS